MSCRPGLPACLLHAQEKPTKDGARCGFPGIWPRGSVTHSPTTLSSPTLSKPINDYFGHIFFDPVRQGASNVVATTYHQSSGKAVEIKMITFHLRLYYNLVCMLTQFRIFFRNAKTRVLQSVLSLSPPANTPGSAMFTSCSIVSKPAVLLARPIYQIESGLSHVHSKCISAQRYETRRY